MEAIKNILVPIDFSENSENALKYAIHIAKSMNAKITLLHAFHVPALSSNGTFINYASITDDYKAKAIRKLDQLKYKIPELSKIQHETEINLGFAVEEIISLSKKINSDLIVMGTKGASGLKEIFLGSNTVDVIDKAKCSVLAIPEGSVPGYINKIAFAYDYAGISSPDKLQVLTAISECLEAEVQILNVQKVAEKAHTAEEATYIELDNYLSDIRHTHNLFIDEDVEEGIQKYIEENEIDLLTIMPREHGFLEELFTESLTEKMAFHTRIPLLVLKT